MDDFLDYIGLKYYDKKLKEYFDKEIENQIENYATKDELQNLYNLIIYGLDYFYIESLQDNNIITFDGYHLGNKSNQIEYSINNEWNSLSGVSQLSLNNGEKVHLRCIDGDICRTNTDNQNAIFDTTYEFNIGGNIETLLFDCTRLFEKHTYIAFSMYSFFRSTKVVNSSKLILPATTLATDCYNSMFSGCTSLTTAPELHATRLVNTCYALMFQGCSSLNEITCYAQNYSVDFMPNWVQGVSTSGTFKTTNPDIWDRGASGIPENWEVIDYIE